MTILTQPAELNPEQPLLSLIAALGLLLAVACGALAAVFALPFLAPGLVNSILGPEPKAYWELARASGIVAYLLLWLSVVFGLLVSSKMARGWIGGLAAVDLHQFTSLLALAFALFHALILLGDQYIHYTLLQIIIPFASVNYHPVWVGLGQLAFYLAIPLTFSFYFRKWIGYGMWRALHFASFIAFAFITLHGLLAGTDTTHWAILPLYATTGATVFFLTFYRMFTLTRAPA